MKNILIALFSILLVFPASAQVTSTSGSSTLERFRQNIKDIRTDGRQQIQEIRQTTREEIEGETKKFREIMENGRENLKASVNAHRDELKTKLEKIKDERKKSSVERIDNNIADLNNRMIVHYGNVLDKVSDVLARVGSRTDTAQANGKDVAEVRTAITGAQNAITAARIAVTEQAKKIYSINITDDNSTLKNNVGATRQLLRDDLKKVGDAVKAAREAVKQAAVSLAKIQGVDDLKAPTATSTATSTDTDD